jgi:hypothetical protein
LEPFTEWEAAVIVQAQRDMGNNWLGKQQRAAAARSVANSTKLADSQQPKRIFQCCWTPYQQTY